MSADDDILRDKKHLNTLGLKLFIANFKDCLSGRVNKRSTHSNQKNNKRQKANYGRRQQVNIDRKEYQGQYHRRQKGGKVENFDSRALEVKVRAWLLIIEVVLTLAATLYMNKENQTLMEIFLLKFFLCFQVMQKIHR